jgi:tetratricopeptide (TPR) repeat protein
VAALAIPAAALFSPFASADAPKSRAKAAASSASGEKRYDPDNVTAISQYVETCVSGNAKFAAKDYPGAIDLYRKAIQLAPRNPLGHYLEGEAQEASGNLVEADAAYKLAESLADDRNPQLRAKVLFAIASMREEQRHLDEAHAAWQSYSDYAGKQPDAGAFPDSAKARLQAIDDVMKLEKAYVVVRERIAAEKDGGAALPK